MLSGKIRDGVLQGLCGKMSLSKSAVISSRCTVAVEGNCVLRESLKMFACYLFKEWLKCCIWHIFDLVNISTACLIWWYSLSQSLVNYLMPKTVNTPCGPAYLTLHSASLWKKMPWGHASLNSFITPPLDEPTVPLALPSSLPPPWQHPIISSLYRLPETDNISLLVH